VTAFVDESMRLRVQGLYVVAAVVVIEDVDAARHAARSVLVRRQPRFHWRNESEARRRLMLERMSDLSIDARVYVRDPIAPRRQAGARALCLNALLWDLWQAEVDDLVIETRQPHADAADRRTIVAAQRARRASPTLDYRFDRALDEPVLWMADALAGAAAAQVAEGADYLDLLGGLVTRTDIGP
jgi:hypothetical protein